MEKSMKAVKRIPYEQRTDRDKLRTNWERTCKLMDHKQYSSAIVRAATCAEIATNIAIRAELGQRRKLDPHFIDNLLSWANGIRGKFERILLPVLKGTKRQKTFQHLFEDIKKLNTKRNDVVHRGYVSDRQPAIELVVIAHKVCCALVKYYQPTLILQSLRTRWSSASQKSLQETGENP